MTDNTSLKEPERKDVTVQVTGVAFNTLHQGQKTPEPAKNKD